MEHWLNQRQKEYPFIVMSTAKAYEEVTNFIAAATTPQNVIAFRPSEESQERITDLLAREKEGALSPEEKSELDHYMQLEHLMRLAKARARAKALTDKSRPEGLDFHEDIDLFDEVKQFETSLIIEALARAGGHLARAAKLLNIKPTTLNSKIKLYGIEY